MDASETLIWHKGPTDVRPEEAGYDAGTLERLNAHYASLVAGGTIQGASYLLARGGRVFANASVGKLTFRADSPDLLPTSIRRTYSITKLVTAVAILRLIDHGRLHLAQSVCEILPEFDTPMHRHIQVFHLLTHTSGLYPDPGVHFEPHEPPWFEWAIEEHRSRMDGNWLRIVLSGPIAAEPGTEWLYSTAGYAVLGEIISRVAGKPYHRYVEEEIAAPLGMSRTFFYVPEPLWDEVCLTGPWEERELRDRYDPAMPPRAGNGMYSTLEDLWRLGQMLLNGGELGGARILSKRATELMAANHLRGVPMRCWGAEEPDFAYGLGVSLDDFDLCSPGTFGHEGYGRCGLFIDPVERLVFVYFAPNPNDYTPETVETPKAIVWSGLL